MRRGALVHVQGSLVGAGGVRASPRRLAASFAFDAGRPRRIERGGTLRPVSSSDAADPILAGFAAACETAGVQMPPAIRCRVVSEIPLDAGEGSRVAATVAGVIGARAMLDLPLSDAEVECIAAAITRSPERVRASIAAHTCVIHEICDDVPATSVAAPF
jgi:homoserine kinase